MAKSTIEKHRASDTEKFYRFGVEFFCLFHPLSGEKIKLGRKNRNKYNLGSTRNRLSGQYCSGLFTISDKVVVGSIRMGWMCTVNNEGLIMCTFVLYEIS